MVVVLIVSRGVELIVSRGVELIVSNACSVNSE